MRFVSGRRTSRTDWETHMARLWMIWAFITSTWQHEAVQRLISDPFFLCTFMQFSANRAFLVRSATTSCPRLPTKRQILFGAGKLRTMSHRAVSLSQRCKGWNEWHVEAPLLSPTSASDCTGRLARTRILDDEHAAKQLGNIHTTITKKIQKACWLHTKNVSRLAV